METPQAPSTMRFAEKIALVTGAASGIGRATALLLAQQGARVVVADLDPSGIDAMVEAIQTAGGVAMGQTLDVTSETAWNAAFDAVRQHWGSLRILVNCAGIALVQPVAEMTLEAWRRTFAVNLDGIFLGTRAAIRSMRQTGGGSIVNVASASGIKAAARSSAYCASKAAVIMFTKTAALECVQDGNSIQINAVAPAGVKTPLWSKTPGAEAMVGSEIWNSPPDGPIGKRFAEPAEIAQAIAFLVSPEASYITGSVLPIDAGYTA